MTASTRMAYAVAFGVACWTTSAPAQSGTPRVGNAAVDSAAQARMFFRSASQASSPPDAVPLFLRAAQSWPTQPAYWAATARAAARASDTVVMVTAIRALAELHAGSAILTDTAAVRMAKAPAVAAAQHELLRTTGDLANGRVAASIADSTVFAEGVDADPRTNALYVASIRHRTVFEITANGTVRDLRPAGLGNVGSVLGVRVANDGRTLYATMAGLPSALGFVPADTAIAALVRIRIADGMIVARWDVPTDGAPHLLGDLVVAGDGTVYASDSNVPVLWVLRPGASTLEPIRHPLFRSLQGLACVPGCQQLVVADYSHGLLRVDVQTRDVTRIADARATTSLGIDGIVWHNDGVIAVQNGIAPSRIARFVLSHDYDRVTRVEELDRQPALADEPTIGTLWRGTFVYVANSQWAKYDDAGVRIPGTTLRPTHLISVPLPRR